MNNSTAKTALAHEAGEIMVYEHPLFGKIRMFIQNGKSWIFDEIVPSVINTGSYSIQDGLPNFNNPAEAARAWADEYERNQALRRQSYN